MLEELRPRAFAIAYRMLGSVSEAEDVVQEALLRLHRAWRPASGSSRRRPTWPRWSPASASTSCARPERDGRPTWASGCPSRWSPRATSDPVQQAEVADSLSMAFLLLLESLSPEQRAVFLLREVFDYPYDRIAEIVGKSEASARQLAVRARRKVDEGRPRFETSARGARAAGRAFLRRHPRGRSGRAGGPARRGRAPARRRRREGAGAGPGDPRAPARGADAGGLVAGRRPHREGDRAARGDQRPARRGVPRSRRDGDQPHGARDRGRAGRGRALGGEPGQAPAPRPGGRREGAPTQIDPRRAHPSTSSECRVEFSWVPPAGPIPAS